jgi:hypothetical protein
MQKLFAEFGSTIEKNHNNNPRGLELRIVERALEELLLRRTTVRAAFAGSMLLQGHDFLPAVDILANWLREYRRDQGRTKSEAESRYPLKILNGCDRLLRAVAFLCAESVTAIWTNAFSTTFFCSIDMSCVIESTTRDSLQLFQQRGQTLQIRPKSLQLQFGQESDDNSARNTTIEKNHNNNPRGLELRIVERALE